MEQKKSGSNLFIVIIIGIIFSFLPTNVMVPYQKLETYQESYTDREAYDVQVPYNDIEYYTEKEFFPDTKYNQQNLVYKVDYKTCENRVALVSDSKVTITATNLDSEGGYFKFWVGLILPDGNKIGQEVSKYIYASQSADFTYTSNSQMNQCTYEIRSIPTKTIKESIINFSDVQKSRSVIIYHTETRYRDIIKTRPAQKYVTDYTQKTVFMFQKILGWY